MQLRGQINDKLLILMKTLTTTSNSLLSRNIFWIRALKNTIKEINSSVKG